LQILMYVNSKYDADLVVNSTQLFCRLWRKSSLELLIVFDGGFTPLGEAPELVRMYKPVSSERFKLSTLTPRSNNSHVDGKRIFTELATIDTHQFILVDKCWKIDSGELAGRLAEKGAQLLFESDIPRILRTFMGQFQLLHYDREPSSNTHIFKERIYDKLSRLVFNFGGVNS